ncbi:MAG: hypothetical protein ORN28_11275 [Rhodoferax sp.]|nr:hypothetical protein [Rhodoferax sp.]
MKIPSVTPALTSATALAASPVASLDTSSGTAPGPALPRYLILTAHHDYRTPRRSSIHFIADQLAKRGSLRFFSLRYSHLSRYKGDIRTPLDARANRVEVRNGVECYLWKTPIHPFAMRQAWLQPLEKLLFGLYQHRPCPTLVQWIQQADVLIYESGIASIFFEQAKRLNPQARHIYLASDDMQTIQAASFAQRSFLRMAPQMDALCLVSPALAPDIHSRHNSYYVPHGLDDSLFALGEPSPYRPGVHAVSVGSMLFDADFFAEASHAFPQVNFHIIGSGQPHQARYAANVTVYGHMPYANTIGYIKHASIGIAPYKGKAVPAYLADSSMKMLQYDFFGIPCVCPHSVVGGYGGRFGYAPEQPHAIRQAVQAALNAPHGRHRQILNWSQVTDRLINPAAFADTRILRSEE